MSREYVLMQTFTAGEDFEDPKPNADSGRLGDLYKLVKLNNDGQVVKSDGPTDRSIGTVQYCVKSGEPTQVAVGGVALGQIHGAAENAGIMITANADGQVVEASSGHIPAGILLEKITANDEGGAAKILITPGLPAI